MALITSDPFYRPSSAPAYRPQKIKYSRWQLLKRAWQVFRGKVDLESYDNLRGEMHQLNEHIRRQDGEISRQRKLIAAMDDAERTEYRKNKPYRK